MGWFDKLTTGWFDKLTTGWFDKLTTGWGLNKEEPRGAKPHPTRKTPACHRSVRKNPKH